MLCFPQTVILLILWNIFASFLCFEMMLYWSFFSSFFGFLITVEILLLLHVKFCSFETKCIIVQDLRSYIEKRRARACIGNEFGDWSCCPVLFNFRSVPHFSQRLHATSRIEFKADNNTHKRIFSSH